MKTTLVGMGGGTFDSVTMLWYFSTADSDGLEYHIWEEDEMEDTENE